MARPLMKLRGLAVRLSRRLHLAAAGLTGPLTVPLVGTDAAPRCRMGRLERGSGCDRRRYRLGCHACHRCRPCCRRLAHRDREPKAWTVIGVTSADLSSAAALSEREHSTSSYAPADEKALWAILRAHRRAVCPNSFGAGARTYRFDSNAQQPTATEEVAAVVDHATPGIDREAVTGDSPRVPSARLVARGQHTGNGSRPRQCPSDRPKGGQVASWCTSGDPNAPCRECPAGDAWFAPDRWSVPRYLPRTIVSDIVVLGQGNRRSTDERAAECAGDGNFDTGSNGEPHLHARIRPSTPKSHSTPSAS